MEDVPISQVPAPDTPGTKSLVDVHISKPRLKPPDPNANEVAPRQTPGDTIIMTGGGGCDEDSNNRFKQFVLMLTYPPF